MNTFTTTAYNSQGQAQETETQTDNWSATEMCLDLSMLYGLSLIHISEPTRPR